ncbi:dihydrolipoamide acetyltransferase family protein [Lewinella sp. JB7]|uniref:dihydrolipoamide acetyltransferase family protein n=1 Tax=Lewinella sp. JB7 TaxID=2962887 RepID=UPI0020C9F4D7|nr:dihydrolipoamide acetyltransferase family protein [Lewinella sp. JB7]MCP9234643.1 2-oxo acid dehydrogenase subunit E2 [Lewinella sp. JB7]
MAQVELVMPKMGESIIEATILNWVKQVGDRVEVDDTVLEIATDKVDSEVPAPVAGTIKEIKYEADSTVAVGEVIALIETEAGAEVAASPTIAPPTAASDSPPQTTAPSPAPTAPATPPAPEKAAATAEKSENGRFYSPLVRTIADKEGISQAELDQIPGTGNGGRVNKSDIQAYLKRRDNRFITGPGKAAPTAGTHATTLPPRPPVAPAGGLASGSSEIIEMGRMRKLIADHMVNSKRTSPHVTSFIEVDVTDIVNWRESIKRDFQQKYGEKITYTPIFIEAVAKAIKDFPLVNVSVDGDRIIKKHDINIGMAAALPTGNLIVPVIRNADQLNLLGLSRQVNDLAGRARANKLKPEEIQDGTFTVTNVGTFGNVMGTPIINQPQVAILAVGAIRKKPAVVETEYGDLIAIRQMMYMSLSYDHRVVDGFLGGSFLRRIGDYLEAFDPQRSDV